ncbi:MAG: hypothetical protein ABIP20_18335, partial [Chthoniobacteraceae bacterium]
KTGSDDDAAIRRIITDKDFEALDALASKFRTEKARYASGMWRIFAFYENVGGPLADTPEGWTKHEAWLKEGSVLRGLQKENGSW